VVSPDGVAPSRMVSMSASVVFPCTIKSSNSLLAPAHPDGPGKKGRKMVEVVWCVSVTAVKYVVHLSRT